MASSAPLVGNVSFSGWQVFSGMVICFTFRASAARMKARRMSGCVLPPCSGVDFQARFGLIATLAPGLNSFAHPPIFAMPASTIFFGSVPCTTTTTGATLSANADAGAAQKLPTAAAVPALRKVRRLIRAAGAAAFCAVVFMGSSICCEKNALLDHFTVAKRSASFSTVTGFKSITSKPSSR